MKLVSLNLFLAMLDKLKHNKFLLKNCLIVALFFCFSCSVKKVSPGSYHTEISCPNMGVILVRYATLDEVKAAIQRAYDSKVKNRTGENYTVIAFSQNRSVKIDNLNPEDAIRCGLREIYHSKPDENYKKYRYPEYKFWSRR